MKISKLFHWLYAILMLLPVAFIGVRCGYVMFNKNAKDSYSGLSEEYITTEITNFNQIENFKNYHFDNEGTYTSTNNSGLIEYSNIRNINIGSISNNLFDDLVNNTGFVFSYTPTSKQIVVYNEHTIINTYIVTNYTINFDFLMLSHNYTSLQDNYNFLSFIQIVNNSDLDNAFMYSINQLNEVPLFSWAQTGFLITPFSYITGLFGLASTSPINTLLSYWLSISIIWLVFDLVMYLPLLVHRWLDKGVLE